jgi:hypothetical protein
MRRQVIAAATAMMIGIVTTATGSIVAGIGGAMAAERRVLLTAQPVR